MKEELTMAEALDKIFEKYEGMSQEEFKAMLDEHEGGHFGQILKESGYIDHIMNEMKLVEGK